MLYTSLYTTYIFLYTWYSSLYTTYTIYIPHNTEVTVLQVIKKLMNREYSVLPKVSYSCSDVRDVALAHMRAMMIKQAAGKT